MLGYTRGPLNTSLWAGRAAADAELQCVRALAASTAGYCSRQACVRGVARGWPGWPKPPQIPITIFFCLSCLFSHINCISFNLRFGSSQQQAAKLSCSVPYFIGEDIDKQWKKLEEGIAVCSEFFIDLTNIIKAEFQLWYRKWKNMITEKRPKSAVAALDHTSSFPNIAIFLKHLSTIPSTAAEAERCFSKLERTLTSNRSTMEEQVRATP